MDRETFRNPPSEYRAAPFWAWNGDLNVDETRRQVRDLAEKGMGGGFMHSRPGLRTEYLGEEWFANCAAAIESGKQAGFRPWIYDEDRWPSGSCGGMTPAEHADYRSRILVMEYAGEVIGRMPNGNPAGDLQVEGRCLGRFRVGRGPSGEMEFRAATEAEQGKDIAAVYERVLPPAASFNGGYYPDLLNEEAVREFIRNTHEAYARRFSKSFGTVVPGVFTDEPSLRGAVPWSVKLPDAFRRRRGYDVVSKLPLLFFPAAESARVRHDFWKTVYELFDESFFAQIGRWCSEHGLAFTGHLMGEDSLGVQIHYGGGAMAHYRHMTIPGIDILAERIDDLLTCKQAASVCNQLGKPVLLSETYGCTGYNFSFEAQKWIGDWQMALGVNFLCPHMSHYTMKGLAKRDYPPSYSYQSPWWRHYRHIADYQARLAYVLRQGRPEREILVLHPLTGAWCRFDPRLGAAQEYGTRRLTQCLDTIMRSLLGGHRDFDLGDELILAEHAEVEDGEFIVANARYKLVIIPPTCNFESSTVALLEKYLQAGGKLLWVSDDPDPQGGPAGDESPALVDGAPSERLRALAHSKQAHHVSLREGQLCATVARLLPAKLSVRCADTQEAARQVLVQCRRNDDSHLLFVANTDRKAGVRVEIGMAMTGAWEQWDCVTGTVSPVVSESKPDGSSVAVELAPAASVVLRLTPNAPHGAHDGTISERLREERLDPAEGWEFRRLAPNSLVLDRCVYRVDEEPFSAPMLMLDAQGAWRTRFGLPALAALNSDVQPWKQLKDAGHSKVLARLALRYAVNIQHVPKSPVFLVLEDRADFEILVNGVPLSEPATGWFMDRSFGTVPMKALLRSGSNIIELRTALTPMRVIEDICLIGDFAVDPATLAVIEEPRRLMCGHWCAQGYPFYTDAMAYRTQFRVSRGFEGRVVIGLERFEGAVAAIWVNGRKAAVLGWRPYQADVTEFLRAGANELEVEIVGSARNLMGPRHSVEKHPFVVGSIELTETVSPGYHLTAAGLMGPVRIAWFRKLHHDLTTRQPVAASRRSGANPDRECDQ